MKFHFSASYTASYLKIICINTIYEPKEYHVALVDTILFDRIVCEVRASRSSRLGVSGLCKN